MRWATCHSHCCCCCCACAISGHLFSVTSVLKIFESAATTWMTTSSPQMTLSQTCTGEVPSKRKRRSSVVLHLSGGSTTCESDNDTVSRPVASSSKVKLPSAHIIVNGKLVADNGKRYQCTFPGCTKAYRKPVRLEEHERTHTGEVRVMKGRSYLNLIFCPQRPFVCSACLKTYFRETHLQAHMRSHLPDSSRSFACSYEDCDKTFWT